MKPLYLSRRLLRCSLALGLAWFTPVASVAQSPRSISTNVEPSSFYGTIAIHGCEVAADELLVRARPIDRPPEVEKAGIAPDDSTRPAYRSVVAKARALDAGKFDFVLQGLAPAVPYRIGVKLVGGSRERCARLAWDVSRDPLVMAGSETVAFDAYAVTSRLEIWGPASGRRTRGAWVSADALDFDNLAAAVRTFRWRSLDRNVTRGQLQVSTAPFPRPGDTRYAGPCSADETALIFKRDFDVSPEQWSTVEVNFNAVVHGGTLVNPVDMLPGDAVPGPGATRTLGVDHRMLTRLRLGHPLYVRVMPTKDGATVCDPEIGIPSEAVVGQLGVTIADMLDDPPFTIVNMSYEPPYIDTRPYLGETCYRITESHTTVSPFSGGTTWDSLVVKHMQGITEYGQTAKKGTSFCAPNHDDNDDGWFESFIDSFSQVLTGLVDEIGDLVNSASAMWKKIQTYAVQGVAAGLENLGVDCDTECQAALQLGLEVALATMGAPPSLPNFDQLMDQGMDYLAAQAASQIGLPPELADYASDKAQQFIKNAASDMKTRTYSVSKLPNWLVPYLRFDPGYLTLEISRTKFPLTGRPGLLRDHDPIFMGRFVQLPSELPYDSEPPLRFPFVLEPNTEGLPTAPSDYSEYDAAVWDKQHWVGARYLFGCYHAVLRGLADKDPNNLWVGATIFKLRDEFLRTYDGGPCTPF